MLKTPMMVGRTSRTPLPPTAKPRLPLLQVPLLRPDPAPEVNVTETESAKDIIAVGAARHSSGISRHIPIVRVHPSDLLCLAF